LTYSYKSAGNKGSITLNDKTEFEPLVVELDAGKKEDQTKEILGNIKMEEVRF
jgi:hypothetical protein